VRRPRKITAHKLIPRSNVAQQVPNYGTVDNSLTLTKTTAPEINSSPSRSASLHSYVIDPMTILRILLHRMPRRRIRSNAAPQRSQDNRVAPRAFAMIQQVPQSFGMPSEPVKSAVILHCYYNLGYSNPRRTLAHYPLQDLEYR
jgi:hypothetical protein